jgi:hypothetical protein
MMQCQGRIGKASGVERIVFPAESAILHFR